MNKVFKLFFGLFLLPTLLVGCGNKEAPQVNYYQITWRNYDNSLLYEETLVENSYPIYPYDNPTRPDDDEYEYTFSGWTPQLNYVHEDCTYTATYTKELIKYKISFDLNGGRTSSSSVPIYVTEFSTEIFFLDVKKDNVNFRGWTYNDTLIVDENRNLINEPQMAKEMTFVAYFSEFSRISIVKNIEEAGYVTGGGSYEYGSTHTFTATESEGYVFDGWYENNTALGKNKELSYLVSYDTEIEARFDYADYQLRVNSYQTELGSVRIEQTGHTQFKNSDSADVKFNSSITVKAENKTNEPFLGWFDGDTLLSRDQNYTFVMPKKAYTLDAKWDYFKISYNLNEGVNDSRNPSFYRYDDGMISIYPASKNGYDFTKWIGTSNPFDSHIAKDVYFSAQYSLATYSITYVLNGGTNDSRNPTTYKLTTETFSLYSAKREGYDFLGWYIGDVTQVEKINKGSYGDLVLYARWSPTRYTLTLYNGYDDGFRTLSFTIEEEVILEDISREGYQFLGWFDNKNTKVTKIEVGTVGSITLTAKWAPDKYNLTVNVNDDNYGEILSVTGEGYTGEEITVVAASKNKCLFDGWYHNGTFLSDELTYKFTMPASDYEITATFFSPEKSYNISHGIIPWSINRSEYHVTYGVYPQTIVDDADLLDELNALQSPESNGWYLLNDTYYAKKEAYAYNSSMKFSNDELVVTGETYWFKCELLRWSVVINSTSNNGWIADNIIDGRPFDTNNSTSYSSSEIRSWLNSEFINKAFQFNVANLSVVDSQLGDKATLVTSEYKSSKEPTDYAIASGVKYDLAYKYGQYWTRTFYKNNMFYCNYNGESLTWSSISYYAGIVPLININLSNL